MDFIASKSFVGPKLGYYFSRGSQGVGYYLDSKSRSAAEKRPFLTQEQPSHEANKRLAIAPDKSESLITESRSDDIEAEPMEPLDATRLQHLLLSFEKKMEGNAEALPFQDTFFDLYSIAFGLRNVTDKPKALREAYRVQRRGGRLMVLEFSHLPNPLLQSLYDSYSFSVIPRLGELISKDADSYQYLVESIRRFPKQARIFNNLFRISSYCLLIRRS